MEPLTSPFGALVNLNQFRGTGFGDVYIFRFSALPTVACYTNYAQYDVTLRSRAPEWDFCVRSLFLFPDALVNRTAYVAN